MGIGYALASGLVKGFTENIGREMERRAGEKEKLDAYRAMLLQASVTGGEDFNEKNAQKIGEFVSAAEKRYDEMGKIDIFGTQGPSVFGADEADAFDTLLSELRGGDPLMKDMTRESIGGYEFLVSDQYTENLGKGRGDVILYDAFVEDIEANKAKFEEYAMQPGARDKLISDVSRLQKAYLREKSTGSGMAGRAGDLMPVLSDIPGYEYLNETLGISKSAQFDRRVDAFKELQTTQDIFGSAIVLDSNSFVIDKRFHVSDDTEKFTGDFSFFVADPRQKNAIDRAAEIQGEGSQFFFNRVSEQFIKEGRDINDLYAYANALADIVDRGGLAAQTALSSDQLFDIGKYLTEDDFLKDDMIMQARVIEPFRALYVDKTELALIDAGVNNESFKSNKPFGEQFKALYGYTLADFQKRMKAFRDAKQKLAVYKDVLLEKGTVSGGLAETIFRQLGSVFGETGTIDQLLDLIGVDKNDRAREKDYLLGRNQGRDKLTAISEADTLRYIIAADLARAEDSAGRLSDGDILRNLQKLTGFGALRFDDEVAAVDMVISDLNRQFSNLTVLDQIATSGVGRMSREQRRLLIGDNLAGKARDEYFVRAGLSSRKGGPSSTMPTVEQIKAMPTYFAKPSTITINNQIVTASSIHQQKVGENFQYIAIIDGKPRFVSTEEVGTATLIGASSASSADTNTADVNANAGTSSVVQRELTTEKPLGGAKPGDYAATDDAGEQPAPPAPEPAPETAPESLTMDQAMSLNIPGVAQGNTSITHEGFVYQFDLTKKAYVRKNKVVK
tara:strand:+ start:446 stop:2812 length:2367 start_codon:yes stop_codon:yes gene_type:complete